MLNEYPHFNTEPKSFIRPKMGKIVDEMGIFYCMASSRRPKKT